MAMKTLMFVCVLVAALALVAPMAEAQLGGIGGLIGNLLGLIRITGTLFCTVDGNMGVNGTATPVFPNALVQLQCGGSVVSSSTTNGNGIFSVVLDPLQVLVPELLNNCNLAVKTPLSNCNASLPSVGVLISSLQLVGSTLVGLLNVTNLIPAGFWVLRP
ncbi:hypothetical protein V6N13_022945 [Hibiscus sabdariffa]|uniref:Phylloplanin n=1 Tax=Hibiscus sabdariffa TaxID=183260 RepID=A0ABR2BNH0_9ROSI